MNILIVEDDTALNNGIALSLNTDTTLQAFSIAEAKSKLDTSVDLVILDITGLDSINIYIRPGGDDPFHPLAIYTIHAAIIRGDHKGIVGLHGDLLVRREL